MAPVELRCPVDNCDFVTQSTEPAAAATILTIHATAAHGTGGGAGGRENGSQGKKPERPTIDVDVSENDWSLFVDSWDRYKRMSSVNGEDKLRDNIRQCCTASMNKRLFELRGKDALNGVSSDDLLKWIKDIAVKGVHTEVHRTRFVGLGQKQGEPIQSYMGRLRSEAALCNFTTTAPATCTNVACNCANHGTKVSYEDDIIATQLVSGLYNKEQQARVLSESLTLLTLNDKLNRLVTLERSETSRTSLGNQKMDRPAEAAAGTGDKKVEKKCEGCNNKFLARFKLHRLCDSCFTKKTRETKKARETTTKKTTAKKEETEEEEAELEMAEATNHNVFTFNIVGNAYVKKTAQQMKQRRRRCTAKVFETVPDPPKKDVKRASHMEFENGKFREISPENPPHLNVRCRLLHNEHEAWGKVLTENTRKRCSKNVSTEGLADTGSQVCIAGPDLLKQLGVDKDYLVPTTTTIRGIIRKSMTILGVMFMEFVAAGRTSKQIVYIGSDTKRLILSKKAVRDLGAAPPNFPMADTFTTRTDSKTKHSVQGSAKSKCGCLARGEVPPMPKVMPLPATDENVASLKEWILQRYASSAFNVCEHQPIPEMAGPPLDIKLDDGAEPVAVHSPIPIPHHWKREGKARLDRDCRLGVIEPVPAGTPTTWCSRMVVAPKHDGSPRRTVDLQKVNSVAQRETHHTPSPWNQVCTVPRNTKKTILDAWNGYHSIPMTKESRDKTTFITEWGRYRYCRAPQGFRASGDAYTKRYDDITKDVSNKTRCVDDSLLWEWTVEDAFWATCRYIDLCSRNGGVFNPTKFEFAQDSVDFAGFVVGVGRVKPTRGMLAAIAEFPVPTKLTNVRAWFGLVNQTSYAYALSKVMDPFRDLLKKGRKFFWDDGLEAAFKKSRSDIVDMVREGVYMFEMERATCLATDWSKEGVGFFLLQKHCECPTEDGPNCGPDHWKLILAGSRFLKDAESRYAPVEGEALAVTYGLEQCRMFILGCPDLLVAVDHKPLVPILNTKALDQIKNPRLLNFKEKTLLYNFKAKYVPGYLHTGPDATSRCPVKAYLLEAMRVEADGDNELEESLVASAKTLELDADGEVVTWEQVKAETKADAVCSTLNRAILEGFPLRKHEAEECLRAYYSLQEDLHQVEGVPFMGSRMHVPASLRRRVLEVLHSSHQGVTGMKAAARQRFWWLGMDGDIDQKRAQCRTCNQMAPSNIREPMVLPVEPEYPFQLVVMDFFDLHGVD